MAATATSRLPSVTFLFGFLPSCAVFSGHDWPLGKIRSCNGKLFRGEKLVEQRRVELLASALRTGLIVHCIHLHAVTFSDINLQLFNRLQPSQDQFLVQFLTSISSICRESSDESVTFFGPFFERLFLASALPLQVTQAITACHSFVTRQL